MNWPELRELVAQLLSRRGAPTSPDGGRRTDRGRVAGYPSALDAISRAGGQPLAVERDAGGLAPHLLERIAALAADTS